jgi:predicted nucleic acid-binding protein
VFPAPLSRTDDKMILYLDTSSLVKLYVEENESSEVDALVKSSEVTATSLVAYAEARAAFARRFREKAFTSNEYDRIKEFFDKDWGRYLILNVTENMIRLAGSLAEKHALRGFDSIHLASALILRREISSPKVFSCFDDNLQKASEQEDLNQG